MADIVTGPEAELTTEQEVRGPSALFSFEGRINRGTFWKVAVLNALFGTIATVLATGFGERVLEVNTFTMVASAILGVLSAWQTLALAVKRWHDMGSSGWYTTLCLIPLVNFFVVIYLAFNPGTDGPNEYGDAPYDIELI
jgi:uncharacterized membrane protein YhaH (DUF805 family)